MEWCSIARQMTVARNKPSDVQTICALRAVARALDLDCAHVVDGTYYFILGDRWALGVSPDHAGRFRLRACYGRREVGSLWSKADDRRRLAEMARGLKAEIESLAR